MARIFNEIGILLELKGENSFKIRAYYNAARAMENLQEDLEVLIRENRLTETPGFGAAIAGKILEWRNTGNIEYYENLKQTTPRGLMELLRIPGLGPKKVAALYSALGVTDLATLEAACAENKLLAIPGFGRKTQEKICAGIQFLRQHQGTFLWAEGMGWALRIWEALAGRAGIERIEIAGSLRRYKPVCKDLDLVVAAGTPQVATAYLANPDFHRSLEVAVESVTAEGESKSSFRLKNGLSVDFRVVAPEAFPHAVQHFTGSKEHNTALRRLAKGRGYKLNEYGLFRDGQRILCRDEAEIYYRLGLTYIPPELRENLGEIEAAAERSLPRLVEAQEIKGLFHVHTTYSDGVNTLREMVEAAINKGYTYLGVADHSRAAVYAHGLNEEALHRQFAEIDQLNQEYRDFRIFKGIEADILSSGELDYDPETLAEFDFVIGSVHSHFGLDEAEMTKRILKAMDDPYLIMLGHPTGRILLERPAYAVNIDAVLAKAVEKGIIIEFNANPYRLDLDWRWCRQAKKLGVQISINPDAHSLGELDLARSGAAIARKGWLEKQDVFNTKSAQEIEEYFQTRSAH